MTPIRIWLLCGVLLTSGGCFLQKKPTVQVPVPAPPAPLPTPAAKAPTVVPSAPAPTPAPTPVPLNTPPPADTPKPSPFPPAATTTPTRPVRPVTPSPVTPTPAPALGAILTADRRKQLDTAYQSDLKQANLVLGKLSGRTLTAQQLDSVSRARAFIRQAAQYHDHDLTTAAELARRARVLTQDLAAALK